MNSDNMKNYTDILIAIGIIILGIYLYFVLTGWRAVLGLGFMLVWAFNVLKKK
jgi:hypothetical protein